MTPRTDTAPPAEARPIASATIDDIAKVRAALRKLDEALTDLAALDHLPRDVRDYLLPMWGPKSPKRERAERALAARAEEISRSVPGDIVITGPALAPRA